MAYLLRSLILLMVLSIVLTVVVAFGHPIGNLGHIELALPSFLFVIFAQAFVMFYFIGSARLVNNVYAVISGHTNLKELFETPPADITPYLSKTKKLVYDASICKRQTIPWTMLMIILGMAAFLLGAAHDTGLVSKTVHLGVVYGFLTAMTIGFFRQWYYLGKTHRMLRKLKALYEIPDAQM